MDVCVTGVVCGLLDRIFAMFNSNGVEKEDGKKESDCEGECGEDEDSGGKKGHDDDD